MSTRIDVPVTCPVSACQAPGVVTIHTEVRPGSAPGTFAIDDYDMPQMECSCLTDPLVKRDELVDALINRAAEEV